MMYFATAGAQYDLKTGAFNTAPNPTIFEFKWGAKEPSVEIQLLDCTGYQAWPFSIDKAMNAEAVDAAQPKPVSQTAGTAYPVFERARFAGTRFAL